MDTVNTILPPKKGQKKPTSKAIVSTERGRYKTVPGVNLMKALGERIDNSFVYQNKLSQEQQNSLRRYEIEKQTLGEPQPCRTDFEYLLTGDNFVKIKIDPAKDWKPEP